MAKQDSNEGGTGQTPEVTDRDVNTGIDPSTVPGTAKTILSTRPGHAFESGVEGVDTITEYGVRVAQTKVDAVLEAASVSGMDSGYITVTTDEG